MRHSYYSLILAAAMVGAVLSSCSDNAPVYYKMELQQPNTVAVLWNPEDYDFEKGNDAILTKYGDMEKYFLTFLLPGQW